MTYWTLGVAPYSKIPHAPIFTTKAAAEIAARKLNRTPGEYKGRGVKASKCDQAGNLIA